MMFVKPQSEHHWLDQLIGEWNVATECQMGPDKPPENMNGRMTCRSLGGLWLLAEGENETPDGASWRSIMTIGFDLKLKRYIGTFIASMMDHLWQYNGVLDASGKKLPLLSEGPSFDGNGDATYRDTIEPVDANHWIFSSEVLGADGNWNAFMTSHNRRKS